MDALDRDLNALAIVPPLGLGFLFLAPSMVLCLGCLVGVLVLGVRASSRRRWNLITPVMYSLMSLTVILAALFFWRVLW